MEEIAQVAINVDPTDQKDSFDVDTSESSAKRNTKCRLSDMMSVPPGDKHVRNLRVPCWIKNGNNLFLPIEVRIGPYHFDENGKDIDMKKAYSHDLYSRNPSVETEVYFKEMMRLEPIVRECYSNDVFDPISHERCAEMMLHDGCFIIEFYLKLAALGHAGWDTNAIIADLYLVENQIPFFVIHKLFAIFGGCREPNCSYKNTCPLIELIFKSPPFNYNNNKVNFKPPIIEGKIHHLLDLFHKAKLPDHLNKEVDMVHGKSVFSGFGEEMSAQADTWKSTIPSATELQKARVTFRRKRNPCHAFDVTFQRGILEMPFLKFSVDTKILLANMIAYEQSQHISVEKRVFTSYVALMDSLINTDKDVSVLESSGVFKNMLLSNKDAADFFNENGGNILLDYDSHHFSDLFVEVQSFCDSTWRKYRARLLYDFATNPWALLSVLTGVIALVLTALQTYYAAKH